MRTLCLGLCAMVAGCSFTLDGPPADYQPHRNGPPVCDLHSGELAFLDGIGIGIAMLPPAIVSVLALTPGEGLVTENWGWFAGGLSLAALGSFAIWRGRGAEARCEKAHLDYRRWMADVARGRSGPPGGR